jgi:hypothetical protein
MRKLHHDISKHGQRYVDGLEKIGSFLFAHLANIHIEKALPGHYKGDILPSKNIFPIPSNLIAEDSYGCQMKEKYPLLLRSIPLLLSGI